MGGFFKPSTDHDADHIRALQIGIDLGMTLVDTAEVYADGHAEEIVGKAIAGRRDQVIVMTKFSTEHSQAQEIIRSLEGSLRRLRTDYVDVYQPHWPNSDVPFDETLAAIDSAISSGKVRAAGLSNFGLSTVRHAARGLRYGELVALQNEYNLEERSIESELLPFCQEHGVAMVAYSPYGQGKLLKRSDRTRIVFELAADYRVAPSQLLLAWVTRHEQVVAIPKASTEDHVRANAHVLQIEIRADDLSRLSEAFSSRIDLVPCDRIEIVAATDDRSIYTTLEQALLNPSEMSPSPRQLADEIIAAGGRLQKPIKLRRVDQSGRYSLVEGRLKYWAWVIAYGINSPIPALIEDARTE